jgi:hypothetical protein
MTTGRAELRPTAPWTDTDAVALEADIQATARALFARRRPVTPSLFSQTAGRRDDGLGDGRRAAQGRALPLRRRLPHAGQRRRDRPPPARVLRCSRASRRRARCAGDRRHRRRSPVRPLAGRVVRAEMLSFARRFIVGSDAHAALPGLKALRDRGTGLHDRRARRGLGQRGRGRGLSAALPRPARRPHPRGRVLAGPPAIDRGRLGTAAARQRLSIKITSLYSQIDPLDFRGSVAAVKDRLRPVVRKAIETGAASISTSSSFATATSPTPSSPSCSTRRSSAPSTRPAWSCRPTCATPTTTSRP